MSFSRIKVSEDATKQLLALDPEGGAAFIDAVVKMDDRKIEQTKRNVEEVLEFM